MMDWIVKRCSESKAFSWGVTFIGIGAMVLIAVVGR